MNHSQTILYEVHNNIYVNITNRCPCSCTFCLRNTRESMDSDHNSLWLDHEPDVNEIISAFQNTDIEKYDEIVFCGFGEPTERLDVMIEVLKYIRANYNKKVRLNTNGLSDLIHNKKTACLLNGLIDTVSISLNTPDEKKYHELVRSKFGIQSFQAMLQFASDCTEYIPNVILTTVATTITPEEEKRCASICDSIHVTYRIRPWED